ncbi:MAG: DUF4402 domain-containing protein [Rikenellaceae bacterium]|nr:DUF4402 domain-containing protein [Rikenellaceae bacterium]
MNKRCPYLLTLLSILTYTIPLNAQVNLRINQGLNFGSLYPVGSGGTVTISDDGVRSSTGSIVLFPSTYNECSFTMSTTRRNRTYYIYSLSIQSPITMTRSGGGSITLYLNTDGSNDGWSVSQRYPVTLYMGGTINVGSVTANPPGNYSGSFTITAHYY